MINIKKSFFNYIKGRAVCFEQEWIDSDLGFLAKRVTRCLTHFTLYIYSTMIWTILLKHLFF